MSFVKGCDDVDPQTSTLDVDAENKEPRPPKKSRSNKAALDKEMEKSKLSYIRRQSSAWRCQHKYPSPQLTASNDEITSFMKSIEVTLRQFSRRDLTRAKKKINDVVFELNTLCHSAPTA